MRLFINLSPQFFPYDARDRGEKLKLTKANNPHYKISDLRCHGHYTYVVLPSTNPFACFTDHNGNSIEVWVSETHHHDNLAVGKKVSYAGTIEFNNGNLTQWSNHSGHFNPWAIYRDQAPREFNVDRFRVVLNDGSLAPLYID